MSLLTPELVEELERMGQGPWRQTGRSTRIALETLAECYRRPGEWIEIRDHHASSQADRHLMLMITEMIERLGWSHFEFTKPFSKPAIRLKQVGERKSR